MTVGTAPPAAARRPPTRDRGPFGDHVADAVSDLQRGYLAERPAAIATLARLRAAVNRPVNASFDILHVTDVPEEFLPPYPADQPIPREHAKHLALTHYAVHQQSCRDRKMHVDGSGLGNAVAELAYGSPNPEAVRRRFAALGTAGNMAETLHHLRGFVRLLRDRRIVLDYGLLAADLVALQRVPHGPEQVRAWWGREYYRTWNAKVAEAKKGEAKKNPTAPKKTDSTPSEEAE